MSNKSKKEKTELFQRLLISYTVFEEEKDITNFKSIYDECFQKHFRRNEVKINNPFHLLELLHQPLENISTFQHIIHPNNRKVTHFPVLENGQIHPAYHEFLPKDKNIYNFHQNEMRDILIYLRNSNEMDFDSKQSLYNKIRMETFISKPFIKKKTLDTLLRNLRKEKTLREIVDFLYVDWTEQNATLCPNCNYPMKKTNSGYKCHSDERCRHQSIVQNLDPKTIPTAVNEYKVLQLGVYFYTCIPGLFEKKVYNELINMFEKNNVILYPELESAGDIKVIIDGKEVLIDCKDQKSSFYLFENLLRDKKAKEMDYIVLPNQFYKNMSNKLAENNKIYHTNFRFICESDLYEVLKEYAK